MFLLFQKRKSKKNKTRRQERKKSKEKNCSYVKISLSWYNFWLQFRNKLTIFVFWNAFGSCLEGAPNYDPNSDPFYVLHCTVCSERLILHDKWRRAERRNWSFCEPLPIRKCSPAFVFIRNLKKKFHFWSRFRERRSVQIFF